MKESLFLKNYYEVEYGLTLLFNQIYGEDEYYRFKENATLADYKKQFSKLLGTIQKSFIDTCKNTDKHHLNEIRELIENQLCSIKKKKTLESLYDSLITFFPRMCFLLIGEIPQNGTKRNKDNRNNWKLNRYRQLEYRQVKSQKENLILNLLKNERINGLGTYREEFEKYKKGRIDIYEGITSWFRRTYPEIYFDLFERTE